jgi:hypothetical protein
MTRLAFFQRVKYEKESKRDLAAKVVATPGAEKIFSCLQRGTCGSAYPGSVCRDYTPQADRDSRGDLSPPLACTGPGERVHGNAQRHGPQYA